MDLIQFDIQNSFSPFQLAINNEINKDVHVHLNIIQIAIWGVQSIIDDNGYIAINAFDIN